MSQGLKMEQIIENFKQIDNVDEYFTKFLNKKL